MKETQMMMRATPTENERFVRVRVRAAQRDDGWNICVGGDGD